MTATWTSRRRACHRVFKAEAKGAPCGRLARAALPPTQQDRLGPHEVDVDPKVADLSSRRRTEPTHELAQAVAVRNHVHLWPVDRRLFAVYDVGGFEERQHGVFGRTRGVLVDKVGAVVRLQREWDAAPSPQCR